MKKKCNFVFMLIDFKIMYKLGGELKTNSLSDHSISSSSISSSSSAVAS